MVKIKICGLSRLCDIDAVNIAKPEYIGFIFTKSRRQITPAQAAILREKLRPDIVPVGVFVNAPADHIISLVHQGVINAIQLHGDEDEAYITKIKALTHVPILKAVSVSKAGDVQKWQGTCADYLLFDKKGGGTGECFDWQLIGKTDKPYFLAGGLNIGNVQAAISTVSPFAVDISSGVETDGFKDSEKIQAIIRRIRTEYE